MSRELFKFKGGIHPPGHKEESNTRPIHAAPLPKRLVIPLRQHIGNPAKPVVQVGDRVLKGQMIAAASGTISAAVHASSSGIVRAIDMQPVPHVSGLPDLCITIETDGRDEWISHGPLDYQAMAPADLRMQLRDMGLAGLGGAVFPSAVKLDPGAAHTCPTLIINGGECEPWITCDDVLMRTHADEILQGVAIMRHLLGSSEILIGIEDNKPEALDSMRSAAAKLDFAVEVVTVPARYPGGGAKQMIETLTGKQVPSGKLSTDIGIQVFNVGTTYSLARAVHHGEPLISRLVTVTGHVLRPQNVEVLIGTPMHTLIALAGERDGTTGVLMGGPMMGVPMPNLDVPVVKATNCILVKSAELFPPLPRALPCIRCTRCAEVCPAELQPQELYRFAKADDFGKRAGIPPVRLHRMRLLQLCLPQPYSAGAIFTVLPRARSGRARRTSAPPTWRANATNSASSARNAKRQEKAEKLAAKAQAKRAELAAAAC